MFLQMDGSFVFVVSPLGFVDVELNLVRKINLSNLP